ncbi:hypothetical protein SAMN04488102_102137 [Alkalibacterium subtropicum]|uniref:Uncharacterized protein n=1 Tax=Alkalibacterium subtropicum TaxID=753702 RepID=A0A1I1FR34_9LACT|nr:hypothetical protein [Alkalibacterium subtropicum]SFB99553.1 hypothetical protein SAMN04488102_102137 [Alkalibacterium subtropicum]
MKEESKITLHPSKTLMIVMTGTEKEITLTVDENDLVRNAEGELDCPMEVTLKKNKISGETIDQWGIESIRLVEMTNMEENVLYEFEPEVIIDLLQV